MCHSGRNITLIVALCFEALNADSRGVPPRPIENGKRPLFHGTQVRSQNRSENRGSGGQRLPDPDERSRKDLTVTVPLSLGGVSPRPPPFHGTRRGYDQTISNSSCRAQISKRILGRNAGVATMNKIRDLNRAFWNEAEGRSITESIQTWRMDIDVDLTRNQSIVIRNGIC